MKCRLCDQTKNLIDAHVIPAWAYRFLYPETDPLKENPLILIGKTHTKRRPIGAYDSGILCKECDNFLGDYDNYGKYTLFEKELERYNDSDTAYVIRDIDTEKFKLFLLSVLWRASISGREEFERVTLGPYEERIKEVLGMIRRGLDVSSLASEYDFIMTKFDEGDYPEVTNRNIQIPHIQRVKGINVGVIYFPRGFKIFIKADKRKFPVELEKIAAASREKEILIPRLGKYQDSQEFKVLLKTFS